MILVKEGIRDSESEVESQDNQQINNQGGLTEDRNGGLPEI